MVNVFDTRVVKPWKSSLKAPVDSLPLEFLKSGLNAFLAALLLFKEGFIQGSSLAGATQHLPGIPRQRDAAGDAHTCLCAWHEDIGVSHLAVLRDKAACSARAPWFQFYSLLPALWDKPAQDHQWLGVTHLIPGQEPVKQPMVSFLLGD